MVGNMSTLLKKIETCDSRAAFALRAEGFQTDSQIQTLTPQRLEELFPGQNTLKLRQDIFEIIQNHEKHEDVAQQSGFVIRSLRSIYGIFLCLPSRTLGLCMGGGRFGHDILHGVPSRIFEFGLRSIGRIVCVPLIGIVIWIFLRNNDTFYGLPNKILVILIVWCIVRRHLSKRTPVTVKYKTVVSGQTFGAHDQILEQIQTSELNLMKGKDEERCITIVFCPVGSRIGTDAEAAVSMVPGDDPVILVFMRYSQEPGYVSSSKVLSSNPRVVSELHVFYHDRQHGLLRCEQNEKAVNELKEELMKHRST